MQLNYGNLLFDIFVSYEQFNCLKNAFHQQKYQKQGWTIKLQLWTQSAVVRAGRYKISCHRPKVSCNFRADPVKSKQ